MSAARFCWREIGSAGDRSCPRLTEYRLCTHCEVFAAAARGLFDRPAPEDYIEQWTRWIAEPPAETVGDQLSLCPFRLGAEWFALPIAAVSETVETAPARPVPHRSSAEFLGLINVRGEPLLCFSLRSILAVAEAAPGRNSARTDRPVTLVCGEGRDRFAFPSDEAVGLWHVAVAELRPPPATVSQSDDALTTHLIDLSIGTVALLDGERLAQRVARALR